MYSMRAALSCATKSAPPVPLISRIAFAGTAAPLPAKGVSDCAIALAATEVTPAAVKPDISLRREMPSSKYCFSSSFMESSLAAGASVRRHPFLHALAGIDLAGEEIALGIELAVMHPVELAGGPARPAIGADHDAILAAHRLDDIVGAVGHDEIILVLVERREGDAPGRAGALRLRIEDELLHIGAVLLEHMDAIVGAVADIDQPVIGDDDAMDGIAELLRLGIVGRQILVGRRLAIGAPHALHRTRI